jgi:4-hydroxyproline epimerase
LGDGPLSTRLQLFRDVFDDFRAGVVCEPRGSEVVVGALLCDPVDSSATTGVLFFNDVGYLGMCGHGTIGVIATLAHMGRIEAGTHRVETPVGTVTTELHGDGSVSVENIPSYRFRTNVTVDVPNYGSFVGDIAWGGNWFFLIEDHSYDLSPGNRSALIAVTSAIRTALSNSGITGANNAWIDHIELFAAAQNPANSSRNFVLCPGASFDRSPCGTGTSANMACLHAGGKLKSGVDWRQEGILGTVFLGSIQEDGDRVIPTITGKAWITAESELLFDDSDPFRNGIRF